MDVMEDDQVSYHGNHSNHNSHPLATRHTSYKQYHTQDDEPEPAAAPTISMPFSLGGAVSKLMPKKSPFGSLLSAAVNAAVR